MLRTLQKVVIYLSSVFVLKNDMFWHDIVLQYPEVESCTRHFKFPGQGQRNTPVTDARGIVEILVSRERCARILQSPVLSRTVC
jgi:hypothetical protein